MNNRPAPAISNEDLRRWIDRIGDATIPLFAGFGFATLIVVCADASKFRWPALTIFVLTIASVFLIMSVQGTHQARMYLPTLEDFQAQRESKGPPANWEDENSHEYKRARSWGQGTRLAYHAGIVALLAGLALALAPPGGTDTDYILRWSASAIAFFACLGEFRSIVLQWIPRRHRGQHDQSPGHQANQ
jgi:peptidoglycan/LPS O-acetylase OafA/YrhL